MTEKEICQHCGREFDVYGLECDTDDIPLRSQLMLQLPHDVDHVAVGLARSFGGQWEPSPRLSCPAGCASTLPMMQTTTLQTDRLPLHLMLKTSLVNDRGTACPSPGFDIFLTPKVAGGTPTATYTLRSVIEHQGADMSSGHYTSFVSLGNAWVEFNDNDITNVSEDVMLKARAAMLLYQRVGGKCGFTSS